MSKNDQNIEKYEINILDLVRVYSLISSVCAYARAGSRARESLGEC